MKTAAARAQALIDRLHGTPLTVARLHGALESELTGYGADCIDLFARYCGSRASSSTGEAVREWLDAKSQAHEAAAHMRAAGAEAPPPEAPEEPVLRVARLLKGRRDMNLRTAELHPDPDVRATATIRAAAYDLALSDCVSSLNAWDVQP